MINHGKHPVLGVAVSAVDYEWAVDAILRAAQEKRALSVSALAVHGVMTGFQDEVQRRRLNGMDLVLPDGQPVRWALRWIHGIKLPDTVCGPQLTLLVLEAAAARGLPVYFYGSTTETLQALAANVRKQFPQLRIAGQEPSKFRQLTAVEKQEVVQRIHNSGARIVFVGLGCPRQEVWAYEYRDQLQMPVLAVGAAFSFHAGLLNRPPRWVSRVGLEWFYRLVQEPRRLWRRYLLLNPVYLTVVLLQALSLAKIAAPQPDGNEPELSYG